MLKRTIKNLKYLTEIKSCRI